MSKIWRTGSLDSRAASIEERTEPSPQFREQAQESGGLAGLSSSGQHDHRARLRGVQAGFNSASNPHIHNIRYNRISCTKHCAISAKIPYQHEIGFRKFVLNINKRLAVM